MPPLILAVDPHRLGMRELLGVGTHRFEVPAPAEQLLEVACLGDPDPVGMKVYAPAAEETYDDIQTTEEAEVGADRREAA